MESLILFSLILNFLNRTYLIRGVPSGREKKSDPSRNRIFYLLHNGHSSIKAWLLASSGAAHHCLTKVCWLEIGRPNHQTIASRWCNNWPICYLSFPPHSITNQTAIYQRGSISIGKDIQDKESLRLIKNLQGETISAVWKRSNCVGWFPM